MSDGSSEAYNQSLVLVFSEYITSQFAGILHMPISSSQLLKDWDSLTLTTLNIATTMASVKVLITLQLIMKKQRWSKSQV